MTPEKRIQNSIINYLKTLDNCFVERRQAGGFAYKMGLPDVYCVYKGKHIEIEVKVPGKDLRPMQEKWKKIFEDCGAYHITCKNVEDLKTFIGDIING